jgi:surface polysaccharide O-acyltransferase-like enzyme
MTDYLRTKIKVLSFFLVLLVVIVHAYNTSTVPVDPDGIHPISGLNGYIQEFICQGINRIASPLFFIISGYLFFVNLTAQRTDFVRKVKKRFFTLIVPYLFWSVWGILVYLVLQAVLPSEIVFSKGLITDYDQKKLLYTIFLDPVPYQLWYVRDLSIFVILSPLIYVLLRYLKVFLILILIFTWIYDFDFVIFRNQSILFFAFGAFISHMDSEIFNHRSKWAAVIFTSLWIMIIGVKTTLIYYDYQTLIVLRVLHKISIVMGILAVNSLYNIIFVNNEVIVQDRRYKILSYSFFLFASHEPVSTVLKKGLLLLLGTSQISHFMVFVITPVLVIIICLYPGYYLKRLLPKVYGTITGWR